MTSLKVKNEARLHEEQKAEQRKKSLVVLILNHLVDNGYVASAEKLQLESGISLQSYEVADNIDLVYIVQEFEQYFEMKHNKKVRLARKRQSSEAASSYKPKRQQSAQNLHFDNDSGSLPKIARGSQSAPAHVASSNTDQQLQNNESKPKRNKELHKVKQESQLPPTNNSAFSLAPIVVGKQPVPREHPNNKQQKKEAAETVQSKDSEQLDQFEIKMLKPLPVGNNHTQCLDAHTYMYI